VAATPRVSCPYEHLAKLSSTIVTDRGVGEGQDTGPKEDGAKQLAATRAELRSLQRKQNMTFEAFIKMGRGIGLNGGGELHGFRGTSAVTSVILHTTSSWWLPCLPQILVPGVALPISTRAEVGSGVEEGGDGRSVAAGCVLLTAADQERWVAEHGGGEADTDVDAAPDRGTALLFAV
jgi:hypothetical protein